MTTPSADAIRLSVKLSGHTQCQRIWHNYESESPCECCLADAATIDRQLLLPEKHAVLFAAQEVVDIWHGPNQPDSTELYAALDELAEALAKIKT
jgi:hypothetical protein